MLLGRSAMSVLRSRNSSEGVHTLSNGIGGNHANTPEKKPSSGHNGPSGHDSLTVVHKPLEPTRTSASEIRDQSHASKTEIHVLRDSTSLTVIQCKKELGSRADDVLSGTPTFDSLLDFIATERLRSMPRKGSKWDEVLKWAESFARNVDLYSHSVSSFIVYSWESARLVWGSCRFLLQMGPSRIGILEKIFGILDQMGDSLDFFLRNKSLFTASTRIKHILACAYADMVSFITEVGIHYTKKNTSTHESILLGEFDLRFGRRIDSFFHHKDAFTNEVWTASLRTSTIIQDFSITVRTIRQWLAPQDRIIEILLSDRMGHRSSRIENTCEWFGSHLRSFQRSKDNTLVITGKPGSGKSVVLSWILERLRKSSGRNGHQDVVSVTIEPDLRSQRSSLSVIKSLLLQMLDRSVGNVSLYKVLSAIYERAERQSVLEGLEPAMWKALEAAIKNHSHSVVVTVDGLDQLKGGEPAVLDFCNRLQKIAASHNTVKCILLLRLGDKPYPLGPRQFVLDSTYNLDDVRSFIEDSVSSAKEFTNLKEQDKHTVIQKVTKMSAGTFLLPDLMLQLLKREKTLAGILQALETIPKGLPDLLQKVCSVVNFNDSDTKSILSCLLVAERPLTLLELKSLIEMDTGSCRHSSRFTSIEEDICRSCGPLVTIRDGIVRFSHHSTKEHLLHLAGTGKFPFSIKEAHKDLVTRCLAYVKVCLEDWSPEPVFECGFDSIQGKSLGDLTKEYHLLEYSTRYWVSHFRKSTMYESRGKYTCTSEFKRCFPNSSFLALVEGSWWEVQTSTSDAMEMHLLALELRKSILGEKHKSVVQCYFNLGRIRRELSDHIKASECYFDAWTISQHVLGEKSAVTMACAKAYSEIITRTTVTTHTEITSRLVQIYKFIWTSHKHIHGAADEETIKYATYLATLYIQLKELEKAATVYREIHRTCVEKYGHLHELTITITRSLTSVLQRLSKHEECVHICRGSLEVCEETLEVWDERRITATICMVEEYESQKQWHKAEEILLSLRRRILDICQSSHDDHCHESKIEITIQYARFLKRHSREKEAEIILAELWDGVKGFLQGEHRHSETLTIRIRIVGEEMKKLKIITVAESVFTSLWEFYKRFTLTTTKEAVSIAVLLSEVFHIRMDVHKEEMILKEIFEATFTHTHIVETATITTCVKLGFFYERESRWSEAIDVCHKVLVKIWPHIDVHHPHEYYLPHHHHDDVIMIGHRLALCHHHAGRTDKAENTHIHVFRSCKSSLQLHDERILTTAKYLVGFYESTGMIEKSRAVYYELLEEYRGLLGRRHYLSVKIMYLLAHHCERHEPRGAEQFYLDIVTAFGHDSEQCDTECIEAILALCRIYEHDQRFKEAQKLYRRLWLTFRHHGGECGLTTETVMEIYHKYLHILEKEHKFSVIYELAVQYRDTCTKYYGSRHHYTIQATIELCKILEREESRHEEAMALYEELCTIITESHEHTAVIEKIIVEVRERLAHLYSCHTSTTGKAEVIYYESWDKFRCKHGHAHEETLHRLTELIMFFKKQNTKECKHTASETLQITIIDILTKEKDTQRLFYSAEAIARLYITLGLEETAFQLLREIRRQLTCTKTETSEHFHFSLRQGHTVDRRSFVFVVAFAATLKGEFRSSLFAEIMSDLMTETTLFESWMRALKYGGRLEVTMSIGARLRAFLRSKHREDESEKITFELWELFTAEVGGSTKKNGILWELFLACLGEMEHEEHRISFTDAGATAVVSHYDSADFKGAFELASWVHNYILAHGDYGTQENLKVGFKLSLCMAGRNRPKRCQDQELSRKMMELSGNILVQVLKVSEQEHMSFSKMPVHDLNLIVGLLGEQRNFKDLQRILRDLWNARQMEDWGVHTIVWIGRRLCEVLFVQDYKNEAIALCKDVSYNLQRVYGTLDKATLGCFNLLSSFYTTAGKPEKAMALHERILQQALAEESNDRLVEDASGVVLNQLQLLKRAYQRNGKWDKDEKHYRELWDELSNLFGPDHQMWTKIENMKKWLPKGGSVAGESLGTWEAPKNWEFPKEPTTESKRQSGSANHHHHHRHDHNDDDDDMVLPNHAHHHHHASIGAPEPDSHASHHEHDTHEVPGSIKHVSSHHHHHHHQSNSNGGPPVVGELHVTLET